MEDTRNYADECGDHGGTNSSGNPCGRPAGWGVDADSGKCRQHRGTSPDGSSHEGNDFAKGNDGGAPAEHNQNAAKHYGYSMAEHLKEHLDDWEEARVKELLSDYVEKVAPFDWDDPRVDRLEMVCVKIIQEWRVELKMLEEGMSEQIVVGTDEDGNPTATNNTDHHLRRPSNQLSNEIRMTLKDLSCLGSPEENLASAQQDIATMWDEDLKADD